MVVGKKIGPFILFTATARPVVADNELEARVRWIDGSIGRPCASIIAPIGIDLDENEEICICIFAFAFLHFCIP